MAIDPSIPLSVQPLNIPGLVGAAQQYQTGQKRNQLLDLSIQQEQAAMPAQAAEQQNTVDIQRLKSTVLGAEGLRQFVDAGDLKGGLAYLQGRKATLDSKKIDSSDTDRAIAAVHDALQTGDPTKVKAGLDQARAVGEKFGILGKQAPPQTVLPANAKLVGAEGNTIAENPAPKEVNPLEQARLDETVRHNKATEAATKPNAMPSGYEADPNNPGAVRPIKGGPHDPDAVSGGMDSRSSVMFNRVAASAQAATKAIENIMELPISTSTGLFGTAEPGKGLFDSARNVLAQKVTGQEAQDFKTMVAGVARNLSTIETAGLAPNGAITNSMNNVLLGEGDTQMTKLRKMAEMRQIVEENLKPQLANPKLAPTQKDLLKSIIGQVQAAVPFTHHDITMLQSSKNPNATIRDFSVQQGLPSAGAAPEITATGPNGEKIVLRNGQWVNAGP